ncbi:MAG: VWA domain-containing protein [Anaerolineales bacterium]|jgi:VWFA-related protein
MKKMINNQRIFIVLSIVTFLLGSGSSPSSQARQNEQGEEVIRITQVDTTQFPQVTLYVSITDAAGNPIGVSPANIIIQENGVPIPLEQIHGVGEVGPLTTLLVMDVSGSMHTDGKLEAAKAAAHSFIDQMRAEDQFGLVTFSTEITYAQPITTDRNEIKAAIDRLVGRGDTAMYDALSQAVDILEAAAGRKAIIALTDGLDNRSVSTPEEVISRIGPAGLSISTVGLGNPEHGTGATSALDEDALIYLAENAGGLYGYANDETNLRTLYQSYAVGLKSEYVLTYTSPSQLRDGVNRALTISLADRPSAAFSTSEGETVYNPGGLVPEVAEPASWPLFFGMLGGLLVLLLIPGLVNRVVSVAPGGGRGGKKFGKKKSRIKLLD